MKKFCEILWNETEFDIKLRNENYFDMKEYMLIKESLTENSQIWRKNGNIPLDDAVALVSLVEQLAGGNRFHDEDTALKIENACIEIMEIVDGLFTFQEFEEKYKRR